LRKYCTLLLNFHSQLKIDHQLCFLLQKGTSCHVP